MGLIGFLQFVFMVAAIAACQYVADAFIAGHGTLRSLSAHVLRADSSSSLASDAARKPDEQRLSRDGVLPWAVQGMSGVSTTRLHHAFRVEEVEPAVCPFDLLRL